MRFGGDFTISADLVIKKLPKPAQEDGAAIGLAIAFQDANQPDVTLVRLLEPKGADVYRSIEKAMANPMQMQMQMQMQMSMRMMMMGGQPRQAAQASAPDVSGGGRRGPVGARTRRIDDSIPGRRRQSTEPRYLGQVQLGPKTCWR